MGLGVPDRWQRLHPARAHDVDRVLIGEAERRRIDEFLETLRHALASPRSEIHHEHPRVDVRTLPRTGSGRRQERQQSVDVARLPVALSIGHTRHQHPGFEQVDERGEVGERDRVGIEVDGAVGVGHVVSGEQAGEGGRRRDHAALQSAFGDDVGERNDADLCAVHGERIFDSSPVSFGDAAVDDGDPHGGRVGRSQDRRSCGNREGHREQIVGGDDDVEEFAGHLPGGADRYC